MVSFGAPGGMDTRKIKQKGRTPHGTRALGSMCALRRGCQHDGHAITRCEKLSPGYANEIQLKLFQEKDISNEKGQR